MPRSRLRRSLRRPRGAGLGLYAVRLLSVGTSIRIARSGSARAMFCRPSLLGELRNALHHLLGDLSQRLTQPLDALSDRLHRRADLLTNLAEHLTQALAAG